MTTDNDTTMMQNALTSPQCQVEFPDVWERLKGEPTYIILGVQGSGTNLLLRLLKRCFRMSVVRDRSLVIGIGTSVANRPAQQQIATAVKRVRRSLFPGAVRKRLLPRAYYRQALEYEGIEDWIGKTPITSAAELCDFFYSYQCFRTGGLHKGIKSDDIWQFVDHIDLTIPHRRCIRLVRDPRDNALSITNKGWGPVHPYVAARFVQHQSQIYDQMCDRTPSESIVVKYERMLARPMEVVRTIADALQLEPVEDVAGAVQRLNIRSSNREKWRSLPTTLLAACESVLSEQIAKYGYSMATSAKVTRSRRIGYRINDTCRRIPQKIRGVALHRLIRGYQNG